MAFVCPPLAAGSRRGLGRRDGNQARILRLPADRFSGIESPCPTKPAAPHPGLQRRSAHRTGAAPVRRLFSGTITPAISTGGGAQRLPRQHAGRGPARGDGIPGHPAGWIFPAPIGKGGALIEGLKLAGNCGYHRLRGCRRRDRPGGGAEAACRIWNRRIAWWARAGCRAACCSRPSPNSGRSSAACFHLIVELLFWLHIKDTQCPCKLMRRAAVEKIHSYLRIADLAFDVNLLVAMKQAGFRLLEVPIEWTDVVGSKVTSSLVPPVADDVFVRVAGAADLLAAVVSAVAAAAAAWKAGSIRNCANRSRCPGAARNKNKSRPEFDRPTTQHTDCPRLALAAGLWQFLDGGNPLSCTRFPVPGSSQNLVALAYDGLTGLNRRPTAQVSKTSFSLAEVPPAPESLFGRAPDTPIQLSPPRHLV